MDIFFNKLIELKVKLQNNNSSLKKKKILKEYEDEDIKKILKYVYSPYKKYNVTSKKLKTYYEKKYKNEPKIKNYENIFNLLEDLSNRKITGNIANEFILDFIGKYKQYDEIIYNILDKDLQIRMNTKTINTVFKDLIPDFKVSLAELYDKHKEKLKEGEWYISRKMDGIRCICIVDGEEVKFYSRQGNELETLDMIKKEIIKNKSERIKKRYVLDGELCIIDKDGNEDFKQITKHFRKKNHQIPNPKYKVFDYIEYEDFIKAEGEEKLSIRLEKLKKIITSKYKRIEILKQIKMTDEDIFNKMWEKSNDNSWEGLILRKDTNYKGKRSNEMLKVKKFYDDEFTVLKYNIGPFRIMDKEKNKEKIIETLTSVVIEYKGNYVNVGSGFTINEREYYKDNPEELVGNKIKVQWFEEIKTKDKYSLRFPTYKGNYGKKRIL